MKSLVRFVVLCGVMATAAMFAQQPTATGGSGLSGHVNDSGGHPLQGANVVLRSDGAFVANAETNDDGNFTFRGTEGMYDVTISHQGFETLKAAQQMFAGGKPTAFVLVGQAVAEKHHPFYKLAPDGPARWEYGALVQGGVGLQDRSDFRFIMVGLHAGKILTPEFGPGLFKANLEYAVEVFPFWQSRTGKFQRINCPAGTINPAQCSAPFTVGGTFTGASVTPIMVRLNMTHSKKIMPWLQGGGGVLWTNHKYPAIGDTNYLDPTQSGPNADTSVWNFTPQGGIGVHYFLQPRRSIDLSANGVHISSASLGDKNPGVNSSVQFSVGYSWWK